MRDEHRVNPRQLVWGQRRAVQPTDQPEGDGSEGRIGDDVQAIELHEDARMAEPGDLKRGRVAQSSGRGRQHDWRLMVRVRQLRWGLASETPTEHVARPHARDDQTVEVAKSTLCIFMGHR